MFGKSGKLDNLIPGKLCHLEGTFALQNKETHLVKKLSFSCWKFGPYSRGIFKFPWNMGMVKTIFQAGGGEEKQGGSRVLLRQACSRRCDTPPNLQKRSTFDHKMGQKLCFCRRDKGKGWFKRLTYLGILYPPWSCLWACAHGLNTSPGSGHPKSTVHVLKLYPPPFELA